jgi:hypothetical protein
MKIGVRFEISNEYGKFISDVLQPFNYIQYKWQINNDEIYVIHDGKFTHEWLFTENLIYEFEFFNLVNDNIYYMIFSTLKAFPKEETPIKIDTYEEFVKSKCELIMMVADSSYVELHCKDISLIDKLYNNAKTKGYENIKYIYSKDYKTEIYEC